MHPSINVFDDAEPEPMGDGLYWCITASTTPPDPTDPAWQLTPYLDDGSVNDELTWVGMDIGGVDESPTDWLHCMDYRTAGPTRASYTSRVGWTDAGSYHIRYWNGASYTTWHNPVIPTGTGTFGWYGISGNPTDQASIAVVISTQDAQGLGSGPWTVQTADMRIS